MVKYLITSGNSQTGRTTIVALKALGEHDIVAGARQPAKSEQDLKSAGASEVVEFDFTKPETVEKALKGVERVLVVHGATDPTNFGVWTQVVVDAAKKTDSVKIIAKIAGYSSDVNSPVAIPRNHAIAAEVLKKSGYQYFTVGPCFFFENWLLKKSGIQSSVVYGASGDASVMYISADDIGAVAAIAFRNIEKYNGQHLPIVAQNISEPGVLQAINEATGINAKYVSITPQEYQAKLIQAGVPELFAVNLATFESVKARGITGDPNVLKAILGRDPITAATWAKSHSSAFK